MCGASFGRADVLRRHERKCPEHLHQKGSAQDVSRERPLSSPASELTAGSLTQWVAHEGLDATNEPASQGTAGVSTHITNAIDQHGHESSALIAPISPNSSNSHTQNMISLPVVDDYPNPQQLVHNREPSMAIADYSATRNSSVASQAINSRGEKNLTQDLSYATNSEGSIPENFLDLTLNDFGFLEDVLLPENFNRPGLNTPKPTNHGWMLSRAQPQFSASEPRRNQLHATSAGGDVTIHVRTHLNMSDSESTFRAGFISDDDVQTLRERVFEVDVFNRLEDLEVPSRSRIIRCLNAYFEYFDPHTPIVHLATFSVSESAPALVLAILSIGAVHVSEHSFAEKLYGAACMLLAEQRHRNISQPETGFLLWPIQATLLCVQFGAFSDNALFQERAQEQLSTVSTLLRRGTREVADYQGEAEVSWSSWIFTETYSRVACWAATLSGIILAFDPSATCVVLHQTCRFSLPCQNSLWRAQSSDEWLSEGGNKYSQTDTGLWAAVKTILLGQPVTETTLSPFGLLAVIGSILAYISSHERLSMGILDNPGPDFSKRMEKSLLVWESLWRRHPEAEQVPGKFSDPLLADCFSLLGSAYYHLYMSVELQTLKRIASEPQNAVTMPTPQKKSSVFKAVSYAANSWLVRSKMGIQHLKRTAPLRFGGHSTVTAYEGALILSWWLSLGTVSPVDDPARVLDSLFRDIFDECEDQEVPVREMNRAIVPLVFYQSLLQRWIWTYTSTMSKRLEQLAEKVLQQQA